MPSFTSGQLRIFLGFATIAAAFAQQRTPAPAEFVAWLPVTDAERALKTPFVEKDAGAEVLIWRVRVSDEVVGFDLQRVLYNYIRIKVFDEKGREKVATVDLSYREPGTIINVSGRTIKADGSIVELDPKTITRRDLFRAGHFHEKAVSFAMPAVEPGAIVEYRWKQTEDDNRFRYIRLHFQRDLPVQRVTYYVKPLSGAYVGSARMYMLSFHCNPTKPAEAQGGWEETSLENIPARSREPYEPSEPNIEQWALLYYREGGIPSPDKYWRDEGKLLYKKLKDALKTSDEIKAELSGAVAGANDEESKILALTALLRKHVRSLNDPSVTAGDRQQYFAKLPRDRDRNSAEVLRSGLASPYEMNVVLAGLAAQAGLDARPALLADKSEAAFDPKSMADRYFLDGFGLALKAGSAWRLVDASNRLLAPGMLPWQKEGVYALISDPKEPVFIQTPRSSPDFSRTERSAKLQLSLDGELSGDVEERYTGHRAEDYRAQLDGEPAAQQQEWFRDRLNHMFPESEISEFKIDGMEDNSKPVHVRYHLEAPHFAQVTGKRILFQPNVFRRAEAALFTASDRKNIIEFPYAWKDTDQIEIELPPGFDLDNADNPGGMNLGEVGAYQLRISVIKGEPRVLRTNTELAFGNDGRLYFDAKTYSQLKKIFDEIHIRDTHFLSIKAN